MHVWIPRAGRRLRSLSMPRPIGSIWPYNNAGYARPCVFLFNQQCSAVIRVRGRGCFVRISFQAPQDCRAVIRQFQAAGPGRRLTMLQTADAGESARKPRLPRDPPCRGLRRGAFETPRRIFRYHGPCLPAKRRRLPWPVTLPGRRAHNRAAAVRRPVKVCRPPHIFAGLPYDKTGRPMRPLTSNERKEPSVA